MDLTNAVTVEDLGFSSGECTRVRLQGKDFVRKLYHKGPNKLVKSIDNFFKEKLVPHMSAHWHVNSTAESKVLKQKETSELWL